jgi:hypothetical protein
MGNVTYKGMVEWEEEFEGEKTSGAYSTSDKNVFGLASMLVGYAQDAEIIRIEIKKVKTD